jgi:hypothetical protein
MRRSEPSLPILLLALLALLLLAAVADAQGTVYLPAVPSDATPTPMPPVSYAVPAPYGCFYGESPILRDAAGVDWFGCLTSNGYGYQVFRHRPGGGVEHAFDPKAGGNGVLTVGQDGYGYLSVWTLNDEATDRQEMRIALPNWSR